MAVRLAGVKSPSMEFVFMIGLKRTATFLAHLARVGDVSQDDWLMHVFDQRKKRGEQLLSNKNWFT